MKRGAGYPLTELPARFWSKVDILHNDECWEWRGARNDHGYGSMRLRNGLVPDAPQNPRHGSRAHIATRIAWYLTHGEWPGAGLDVCHRCDNPPCVNPGHLWLGSKADNMRDARQKGRLVPPTPVRKLSDAQIAELQRRAATGNELRVDIARDLGVTPMTVTYWARRAG